MNSPPSCKHDLDKVMPIERAVHRVIPFRAKDVWKGEFFLGPDDFGGQDAP